MCKVLVNKIIPFSSVDGPGNRMVIFLQGCNFNCLYCHNPETINKCINCTSCVEKCDYGALKIDNERVLWDRSKCKNCDICINTCNNNSSPKTLYMTTEEILIEIQRYKSFISGITVSGGECTLELDFLISLFKKVKELGLTTFIDTNGSIPLYNNKEIVDLTDGFMIDIKSYNKEEHRKLTGMSNEIVFLNVKYLGINKIYEIRTVIVEGLLDNEYNIDKISRMIADLNPHIRYKLIKYRNHGVRKVLFQGNSPNDETMNKLKEIAITNGCKNVIIV